MSYDAERCLTERSFDIKLHKQTRYNVISDSYYSQFLSDPETTIRPPLL